MMSRLLKASEAQYSLLMHPDGGILDDIIVYREDAESYLVVINAGNAAKDLAWMRVQAQAGPHHSRSERDDGHDRRAGAERAPDRGASRQ